MKKLTLEWIPNAYADKEVSQAQQEIPLPIQKDFLIVKSMNLCHAKSTGKIKRFTK